MRKQERVPLPTEQTLDAYKTWIKNEWYTWWNDRSSMMLNRKGETIRSTHELNPRRLSAAAAIELLREERACGSLSVTPGHAGSTPFMLQIFIGYLTEVHRIQDVSEEDLRWFERMLIELFDELQSHQKWPHCSIQPENLQTSTLNALRHFECADASTWMRIAQCDTRTGDKNHSAVYPFLALAKRRRSSMPNDDCMSDLLMRVCLFLSVGFQDIDDINLMHALDWFRDSGLATVRMRPRMKRWFAQARTKLPRKIHKREFDHFVRMLIEDTTFP